MTHYNGEKPPSRVKELDTWEDPLTGTHYTFTELGWGRTRSGGKTRKSAEDMLRDLLARIHRDGGHYTEAVGLEQSVKDADYLVARLYSLRDEEIGRLFR